MLQKIISYSLKNKIIVLFGTLILIGIGIKSTLELPIDAVPDITNNQVQVITTSSSLGAGDVEKLVTFPVEQNLSNIPGLQEMRSFSRFGLSLVTLVFTDETDVYWARQQVSERLASVSAQLPPGADIPYLAPVSSGLGEIYQYTLKPKKGFENQFTLMELRTVQDWLVRKQLLGVKGVADVSSFGGEVKQFHINILPEKLSAHNIEINELIAAVEKSNQNTGGSYIEKNAQALVITTEGLLKNKDEIGAIPIKYTSSGNPVSVSDVATVSLGSAKRYGAMAFNDEGEVAGGIVMMLKGENSRVVIENIKQRIDRIQENLPQGLEIVPFLDRTKMVNSAIHTVVKNLSEGALIVIGILVLILGNFRAGFIVASIIPLAMLFAITLMNAFGVSGNLMSLGALDFGLIVDGAVIIVEAIIHQFVVSNKIADRKSSLALEISSEPKRTSESKNNSESIQPPKTPSLSDGAEGVIEKTSSKMMNSAAFGQLIILVVYLPIFTLNGIEGKMFIPMAQTVIFALIGAFILTLTYVPVMSALFFRNGNPKELKITSTLFEAIQQIYSKILKSVFRRPKWLLIPLGGLFVLGMWMLSQLGGEFIPSIEEGDFAVESRLITGSNIPKTLELTQKAAGIIKKNFPEVKMVVTKVGSGEIPTDPMPMEAADMMIILKDQSEWTSAKTFDELAEKMSASISSVIGLSTGFQYPVQMRFNELMTGAKQDVTIKIFGENLDSLTDYAHKMSDLVKDLPDAIDVYTESMVGMPQIAIEFDRYAMSRWGINIQEANNYINSHLAGAKIGQLFEDEKRFDLVVKMNKPSQEPISLEDIKNLLIPTPTGERISLDQIAKIKVVNGINQIQREEAKRRIIVGFNVRGSDVEGLIQSLQKKVDQDLKLPPGYYITYGGAFENLQKAKKTLSIAVPISLVLIFAILYFSFHSMIQGVMIFTAIPLSAVGGILALYLRNMPFSISAGIGFIALFGVAVLNGIVLLTEFNHNMQNSRHVLKNVLLGASHRVRPVLVTALVASLGFLPMAMSTTPGSEVQKPLATVVIGGLIFSTLITLFLLPLMYHFVELRKQKKLDTQKDGNGNNRNHFPNTHMDSGNSSQPPNLNPSVNFSTLSIVVLLVSFFGGWKFSSAKTDAVQESNLAAVQYSNSVAVHTSNLELVQSSNLAAVQSSKSVLANQSVKTAGNYKAQAIYNSNSTDNPPKKSITLKECIELAKQNHPEIQVINNEIDQLKELEKIRAWGGTTSINAQLGQVNSWYSDNQFSTQQQINNPLMVKSQSKESKTLRELKENRSEQLTIQIEYQVAVLFQEIVYLKNEQSWLIQMDSLAQLAWKVAQNRISTGGSNSLTELPIQVQLNQVVLMKLRNQLTLAEKEIQLSNWIKMFPLPALTGDFNDLQPIKELSQVGIFAPVGSFENAFKKQSQLQIQLEQQRYNQIKMSMAPGLQVGYVNQSFNGYQNIMGTERFFNTNNRFQSVQIGISAPLIFTGNQHKLKAQNKAIEGSKLQMQNKEWEWQLLKLQHRARLNALEERVQTDIIPMENLLIQSKRIALQQLQLQQMNITEFSRLLQQILELNQSINQTKFEYQIELIKSQLFFSQTNN